MTHKQNLQINGRQVFNQAKGYWFLSILLLILLSSTACAGQAPEASKARSRAVINAGAIVPADEIRVAEYLQYYEHHFPEPERDAVGLDLRLGNSRMPIQGGTVWLQMGLQAKSAETEMVAPLNLAIVIDRSGSMNDRDKMPYVKQSLRIFLESLNPDDIVSIITYSDNAELVLPAQRVGDGRWVQAVIDRIQPGGNTNLHAGMMLGLQEVDKNFDIRRNNRVILLTDGMANTINGSYYGNPSSAVTVDFLGDQVACHIYQDVATAIAEQTQRARRNGIRIYTVSFGQGADQDLMPLIARATNGAYYYAPDYEDLTDIFIDIFYHLPAILTR